MSDEPVAWECFSDPSYYDMWCVRQVGQRTFGEGFHLMHGVEARALCAMLNTRPEPQPSPDAFYAEHLLTITVAKDGTIGIDHETEADWETIKQAHISVRDRLNERLAEQNMCPFQPSPDRAKVDALEGALRTMVYEATHLSSMQVDGSHWCKISGNALERARAALAQMEKP